MIFAFIGHRHVQPGSFADRHIWLSLLIMAVGMSLPLIGVLILVQILKWKGIINPPGTTPRDSESKPKRSGNRLFIGALVVLAVLICLLRYALNEWAPVPATPIPGSTPANPTNSPSK